jgi:hypothetical protein
MMPQASPDPLPDRFNQPLVGSIHPAFCHDMHGQFMGGARALGVAERRRNDAGDFTFVGSMSRRHRARLDRLQLDIGLEQQQRGIDGVEIDHQLARDRLMMFDLAGQLGTLRNQRWSPKKLTKDWPEEAKAVLKAELERRNVGYRELAEKLTAMGS